MQQTDSKNKSPFLTTREVADYYRVKPALVIDWINEGKFPGAINIGQKRAIYRIPRDSLSAVVVNTKQSMPDGFEKII